MDIFDVLTLIGGLCLFMFGMNLMGDALERRAGSKLKDLLGTLTKNKAAGFFTGLMVTSIIQSSSATTVMVVGFVNSGLMTLRQAISVIMGANIGTTVTAWILSLGGISSDNVIIQLFKPSSFTPVLALIGTALLMFGKDNKKKDRTTAHRKENNRNGFQIGGPRQQNKGSKGKSDAVSRNNKKPQVNSAQRNQKSTYNRPSSTRTTVNRAPARSSQSKVRRPQSNNRPKSNTTRQGASNSRGGKPTRR